jgi:single-strand DNA-binding protein
MNRVSLTGRLTRDPESRDVGADNKVASFGLAVDGAKKDETFFFDVEVWGKTAELVTTYLKKGSFAIIDGRLRQDKWEKDGQKNSKVLIVAERVEFGPKQSDGGGEKESAPKSSGKASGKASPAVDEEDLF